MSACADSGECWGATIADLATVEVPKSTSRYMPVSHVQFLEEVKVQIPRFGLTIKDEQFALGRNGQQMFGVITFSETTPTYVICVGLQNSYDRSLSAGLIPGGRMLPSHNLAFFGEVEVARRHTRNFFRDIPFLIYQMLSQASHLRSQQDAEIATWQEMEVTRVEVNHLFMEAVRADAIPASWIPKVLDAYENPAFEKFAPRNTWSLYNAFVLVMQSKSPRALFDDTLRLSRVFREFTHTKMG